MGSRAKVRSLLALLVQRYGVCLLYWPEAVTDGLESKGTEFACFTGTKGQMLTLRTSRAQASQHTSAYVC